MKSKEKSKLSAKEKERREINARFRIEVGRFAGANGYDSDKKIAGGIGISYSQYRNYVNKGRNIIPTVLVFNQIRRRQNELARQVAGFYKFNVNWVETGDGSQSEIEQLRKENFDLQKQVERLKGMLEGIELGRDVLS